MGLEIPGSVHFTSELAADRRTQLEELLFFNERQAQYREAVVESIARFGEPMIRVDRGLLRIHTRLLGPVQALYAIETRLDTPRLIAVAVYARTASETMNIIHVCVHRDFAVGGVHAGRLVTIDLVRRVAAAASRIKNIRRVEIPYGTGTSATLAIPERQGTKGKT